MRNWIILPVLILVAARSMEAAGVSAATARLAANYSASQGGKSFLAIQRGQVLFEKNGEELRKIYSGTKAFWNLAALAAAEDGFFSLDDTVAATIPAWRNDPRKARVTIRQLLDFSSGLEPVFYLHNNDPGDRDRIAIGAPLVANPGSRFIYGPSALQVFHQVLKQKLHEETPTHYLERRVLTPLGLGSQRYLADSAGNPLLAAGWLLTARQWAKLGHLVLADGVPVIKPSSLAQCWRGSTANQAFSLGWWNNRSAPGGREFDIEDMLVPKWSRQNWSGTVLCRDAPRDLVACIGSGYQRLYVIPSLGLVVVRQGSGGRFSDARFLRILLGK
jgi:CubicO group peptidase (beta-lactamase class C family)